MYLGIHKKRVRKTLLDFTSRSGPSDELWEKTPLAVFLTIFTVELMELIAFETNLHASQSYSNVVLYFFGGINLLMDIKMMSSYRDYWANEAALHDYFISSCMSLRRFSCILGHLHLNNKLIEPKKGDQRGPLS